MRSPVAPSSGTWLKTRNGAFRQRWRRYRQDLILDQAKGELVYVTSMLITKVQLEVRGYKAA
jgi:hypothetical protein